MADQGRSWKKRLAIGGGILFLILAGVGFYAYWILAGLGGTETEQGIVTHTFTDDLIQDIPVAIDITPDGRLFIAETGQFERGVGDNRYNTFWLADDLASDSVEDREAYIRKWIERGKLTEGWFTEQGDRIRVIEDRDGDGRADHSTIYAEIRGLLDGLTAGVLAIGQDLLVTSIPRVWKFTDSDGDNRADERQELSYGYGLRTAFVGHDLHGLTRGPDGKIYFSIGDRGYNVVNREGEQLVPPMDRGRGAVFRMNPDGSELEVYATGLRNPQELAFDNYGNLFTGDNNSDGGDAARIVYVVEGGDSGWMFPYQYQAEDDYLRGPWNAEKLWHTYHPGQPAWIVPPIANETRGPSGMTFYPGLGLPERYRDHFFLADYGFTTTRSNILSFAVQPDGAGFALHDVHEFASNELFIDQVFGYDGKLYALTASVFADRREILTLYGEQEIQDARIEEVQELFRVGFAGLSAQRLLDLLGHADRRVRLESQFELARRGLVQPLAMVAGDPSAAELSRIHALWALGQQGPEAFRQSGWRDFSAFGDREEVLAQALKVAGDAGADWLASSSRELLAHSSARVRYFAAMAAGKLGDDKALEPLIALLRANANQDPFLRHAAVWALSRLGEDDHRFQQRLRAYGSDSSAAVRLGVLLAQRHWGDPEIIHFLEDPDAQLVVEAARAIHDLPIEEAMPALAAMASRSLPLAGDDSQSSYALHRRVINANLRLGSPAAASALGRYASAQDNPLPMRELALQTLRQFAEPPVLDAVLGAHRPLAPRKPSTVYEALDRYIPDLLQTELRDKAMDVALAYDRMPLDDSELLSMLTDSRESVANKVNSLQALARRHRDGNHKPLFQAVQRALRSDQPVLRASALEILAGIDLSAARAEALQVARASENTVERQRAIALLGEMGGESVVDFFEQALEAMTDGQLSPEIQLDILEAAEQVEDESLQTRLSAYRHKLSQADAVRQRAMARYGGDPGTGQQIFASQGDCLRCHTVDGRGGTAGPDLTGIANRYDVDYLLEALVEPQASIAPGFGIVSMQLHDGTRVNGLLQGEDEQYLWIRGQGSHGEGGATKIARETIASISPAVSGMPAMGLALPLRELRDVMAYLQTLTSPNDNNEKSDRSGHGVH